MSAPAIAEGELSHRKIMTIIGGLLVGMFLSSLDATIVSTAIRTIGDDLHGLSYQAWVTTAFLIASVLATPILGKLSDIYGRKRILMFSIVIFVVGSMLCGLSQSMYMLAAFRALQGIGAGGITPLSMAVVGDIMSPRVRARYQGYFVMTFGIAAVLGPVIGGFFAGAETILGIAGWRWIFYINVPLGVLAMVAIQAVLPTRHVRSDRRIDWWGTVALIVAVVPLLIIAEQGRELGFASPIAILCYLLGLAGAITFIWVEKKMGEDAIIPLNMFKVATFSRAAAQSFVIGTVMFGGMAIVPLYLQIVKGASPTQAGLLLLPLVGGMMLASWLNGQYIARTGRYKLMPVIGSVLLVIGLALMATINADTSLVRFDVYIALYGAGVGLNMQAMVLIMQNAADAKYMGVSTSASTFFRQIGGALAAAGFLTILFSRASVEIPHELAKAGAPLPSGQSFDLNDSSGIQSLPPEIKHAVLVGFSSATQTVLIVAAAISLLSVFLVAMIKEIPMRTVSGRLAREADAQAELESLEHATVSA